MGVGVVTRFIGGHRAPVATPALGATGGDAGPAALMLDVDLEQALPDIRGYDVSGARQARACVLVRERGRPVALLFLDVPESGISSGALLRAIRDEVGAAARENAPSGRVTDARSLERTHVTVVICTRERPQDMRRALQSLVRQTYRQFRVIVVDNAPETDMTRQIVDELRSELLIDYMIEPRPGLSRARNKAMAHIGEGIVAWLDDDEEADPSWVAEFVSAFIEHPEASAVSGVVIPAELRTQAQLWFEQFGGHSKGRGFSVQVFGPETPGGQSPLFPLPPFGVGANMAFRVEALHAVGGFDEALGAGTLTRGGEDTKVFTQLLLAGRTVVYWPPALTRHYHRADLPGLEGQLRGYGSGLTAFYTAIILEDGRHVFRLMRLAPRALRVLFGQDSPRTATIGPDFPRHMLMINRRAMLSGPVLYLRERLRGRTGNRGGLD